MKKILLATMLLLGLCAASLSVQSKASTKGAAPMPELTAEDELYAKCLGKSGTTMYGLASCPHCKHQKEAFGPLFQYVNYQNCDGANMSKCMAAYAKSNKEVYGGKNKVKGFPTWLTSSGEEIRAGSVRDVAEAAGCSLEVARQMASPSSSMNTMSAQQGSTSFEQSTMSMPSKQSADSKEAMVSCIVEKGVTMYGLQSDANTQKQMQAFGQYFQKVNFVDCNTNSQECSSKGIQMIPTWLTPSGAKLAPGDIEQIAVQAGCNAESR